MLKCEEEKSHWFPHGMWSPLGGSESWSFGFVWSQGWRPECGPGLALTLTSAARCGWMLPLRSSSLLVLALGSCWLSLATTSSTTTVTSEYLGLPGQSLKVG